MSSSLSALCSRSRACCASLRSIIEVLERLVLAHVIASLA
jgi:hypothetical protein